MVRRTLAVAALATALMTAPVTAGCGGARPAADVRGAVRFVVHPESARVYHDGHFVGAARVLAETPESFRVGVRRFTLSADGHFPHDLEVDVVPGTTTVEVSLRPIPP